MKKSIWITLILIVSIIAIDQITKVIFIDSSFSLFGNFLWIESVKNEGAAFGIFQGARWWFVAFSFPVLAALFFLLFSSKFSKHPLFKVSLGFLIAGIVGNLVDRTILGYVRDFLYFKFIENFAIFNIADASLTVGCILILIFVLFVYKEDKTKKAKNTQKENK